jgi:hypothetical protein
MSKKVIGIQKSNVKFNSLRLSLLTYLFININWGYCFCSWTVTPCCGGVTLKMEATTFSAMLANHPITAWHHHPRMETKFVKFVTNCLKSLEASAGKYFYVPI